MVVGGLLAAGGCASTPGYFGEGAQELPGSVGRAEDELRIVLPADYYQAGDKDGAGPDWITPFQRSTGCQVTPMFASSANEMVALLSQGDVDGVAAPPEVALSVVAADLVVPVNTGIVPNYAGVFSYLKRGRWDTVQGQSFGVPQGWTIDQLQYATNIVNPAPQTWDGFFTPAAGPGGPASRIALHDDPSSLGDVALHLRRIRPELRISDPFALDEEQFAAVVEAATVQAGSAATLWIDRPGLAAAIADGNASLTSAPFATTAKLVSENPSAAAASVLPDGPALARSDTWMLARGAPHPNCMYLWMDHVLDPEINAAMAQFSGQAPAVRTACAKTSDPNFCTTRHVDDAGVLGRLVFTMTPTVRCVDGRAYVSCVPYTRWATAWAAVRAAVPAAASG